MVKKRCLARARRANTPPFALCKTSSCCLEHQIPSGGEFAGGLPVDTAGAWPCCVAACLRDYAVVDKLGDWRLVAVGGG